MNLKNVAVAGVIFALAGAVPIALAGESVAPHARAYAFHFGEGGSWLGVSIQDVDAERSLELGLDQVMGAEIKEVQPGSPAEEAGLQAGDVVLRYQGTRVEGVRQFTRMVRETPSGRTVAMEVFRSGSMVDIEATVKNREEVWDSEIEMEHVIAPHIDMDEFEFPDIDIDIPDINISDFEVPDVRAHSFWFHGGHQPQRLGASVDNLTEQLGEYFGVKDGEGILVREVEKDSPGEEAGLRAGDVIVKIDDQDIGGTRDLRRAMHQRQGQEFKLIVIRERKERTLTVQMPEEEVSTAPSPPAKTISIKVM